MTEILTDELVEYLGDRFQVVGPHFPWMGFGYYVDGKLGRHGHFREWFHWTCGRTVRTRRIIRRLR